MSRSIWNGPFFHPSLLKKTQMKDNYQKIKIWSRSSTILSEFVGYNFEIHNGKTFIPLLVSNEMVGHKFGEFSSTRNKSKKK
jgi:small subunit ribosomal protein S19